MILFYHLFITNLWYLYIYHELLSQSGMACITLWNSLKSEARNEDCTLVLLRLLISFQNAVIFMLSVSHRVCGARYTFYCLYIAKGATIWLPGGGGGGGSGRNIFFTCFQRQKFFFSTIEGWTFFFFQCMMREVIFFIVPFVWIIICIKSVICLEKTTIHNLQIYNK